MPSGELVRTVCPFCGMGCTLLLRPGAESPSFGVAAVPSLEYDLDGPVNRGSLCARGNMALELLTHHRRLESPRLRRASQSVAVTWEEALKFLTGRLGLQLSPEKTHLTTFAKGFAFLGFDVQSHSVKMRAKSVEKFKTRVRELTRRSHKLDAEQVDKLNAVVRGVARYYATPFSTCRNQFRELDCWLRMRLRCMKTKRKSRDDNWRYKVKHIRRWNVVFLSDFLCSHRMVSSRLSLVRGNSV